MTDQEASSHYTRGFVAAAIVIGAILVCGALLIFTGEPSDATGGSYSPPADSTSVTTEPGNSSSTVFPPAAAASTPATSPAAPPQTSATCDLPDGDQTIPTKPPPADAWEVSRRVVVPRSTTYGPTTTDNDGFRRCFAHSPTGAVYAAYNAIAALGDQRQAIPTTKKLMLPGPDTTALLTKLKSEEPTDGAAAQLAGYRILDATKDRVTVVLALPVEEEYMSANLTLVWHDDDWRVVPPTQGGQFGAPFSQHRDLDDFVTWKGL
ncbi:hypothetical protein [Kribbella italica]|uniref:DUF8175 domain-containing protein n=1 Tax=Kribbella italica TaxID=1540520 RepID=A0A7W9JCE3_9ACTN|nr:hypothetical protein [Kribbella italica]MBB5839394.1 hypothetical protein [Kribbella italica]